MTVFAYGDEATDWLRSRDPALGAVIDAVGHIRWEVDPDLFASLTHHIVGQQISTKAQAAIWARLRNGLGTVDAPHVLACGPEQLRTFGLSQRKVDYVLDFARHVQDGSFDPEAIAHLPDDEAIAALTSLHGVGEWTAEMTLLFTLQRPNILSYKDLGIQRGLCMLHRHRRMTPTLFARYRRRYTPFCSVASLYLWEVAGGEVPLPGRKETP